MSLSLYSRGISFVIESVIDEGVLRLCEDVCGSVHAQLAELSRLLQASEN